MTKRGHIPSGDVVARTYQRAAEWLGVLTIRSNWTSAKLESLDES